MMLPTVRPALAPSYTDRFPRMPKRRSSQNSFKTKFAEFHFRVLR